MGGSNDSHFYTFVSQVHSLAGPVVMLMYPLYASVVAMESPSKVDDEQWLAYWILYSFLSLMEMALEPILTWIPIWYDIKLIFVAWLVLPQFKGAAILYQRFVREKLRQYGGNFVKVKSDHYSPNSPHAAKSKFMNFMSTKKGEHDQ